VTATDVLVPACVCLVLTALALFAQTRLMGLGVQDQIEATARFRRLSGLGT
jgi:hypothetical protein